MRQNLSVSKEVFVLISNIEQSLTPYDLKAGLDMTLFVPTLNAKKRTITRDGQVMDASTKMPIHDEPFPINKPWLIVFPEQCVYSASFVDHQFLELLLLKEYRATYWNDTKIVCTNVTGFFIFQPKNMLPTRRSNPSHLQWPYSGSS